MTTESVSGSGEFAVFEKPKLQYNEFGWGPLSVPETFRDMPYQPFSKSDRLGKISDWTGTAITDKKYPSMSFKEYDCVYTHSNLNRSIFLSASR